MRYLVQVPLVLSACLLLSVLLIVCLEFLLEWIGISSLPTIWKMSPLRFYICCTFFFCGCLAVFRRPALIVFSGLLDVLRLAASFCERNGRNVAVFPGVISAVYL